MFVVSIMITVEPIWTCGNSSLNGKHGTFLVGPLVGFRSLLRVLHGGIKLFFTPLSHHHFPGWFYCCPGNLSRANKSPGAISLSKWYLLCFGNWRDLPGGWEPVYLNHCKPGHPTHLHAPGVRSHCPVYHSYPDTLGAVAARLHPPTHQDSAKRCPWDAAQYCIT